MKNKKSKIIVPALGLILLSTAASISGSVAWFTANRSTTISVSQFKVERLDGNLTCTLDTFGASHAAAYGATVNQAQDTISIPNTNAMLNASFDHVNKKLFYSEDGTTFPEKTNETNWLSTSYNGVSYYYAIKWKMTFTYQFGSDTTAQNLFFDSASTITQPDASEAAHQAYKGFRMCFYTGSPDNEAVVWAPSQDESGCTFILNGSTGGNYSTNGDLIAANSSASNIVANNTAVAPVSGENAKRNFLGEITPTAANTEKSIDVTAVAWYEGTDANIENNALLNYVSQVSLTFFVRNKVTA